MMTKNQEQIIQSTLPIVAENLSIIVEKFYSLLLTDNPGLKNVFNATNQKTGLQSRSLTNSIAAFAMNYNNLGAIQGMIKQIAHKHCSIGVTAEQYEIVGNNLLAAIDEVLGDVVTDEIKDAWGAFYWTFADCLIDTEKKLYSSNLYSDNNQKFRQYRIIKKVDEALNVFSLYLKPLDGVIDKFYSGQYVSVKVNLGNYNQIRQYSISDVENNDYIRITIKCEANYDEETIAVSDFMYKNFKENDICEISAPYGLFVLGPNLGRDIMLISAGVGITPTIGILKTLIQTNFSQQIVFLHLTENSHHHVFKQELEDINAENLKKYIYYNNPLANDILTQDYFGSQFDFNNLQQFANANVDYYICANDQIINLIQSKLVSFGVNKANINHEAFQPDSWTS